MDDLVSVLVPCYNTESYLARSLESIINQTYKNLEIIVLNDGSTDRSLEIMNDYSNKDNRIRVISRENRGVAYSRNELIQNSKGKYITFVDSDDTIHREMIEKMHSKLVENNCEMAICNFNKIKSVDEIESQTLIDENYRTYNKEQLVYNLITINDFYDCVTGKLFKKELFTNVSFPENRVFEDSAVVHRLYCEVEKAVALDGRYYNYLIGRDNSIMSKKYSFAKLKDNFYVINDRYDCLINHMPKIEKEIELGYIRNILALVERAYLSQDEEMINSDEVNTLVKKLKLLYESSKDCERKHEILNRFKITCLYFIINNQFNTYKEILNFVYGD